MHRTISLFSGQFADLSIADFAAKAAGWGYDGVELACWGEHVDVPRVLRDDDYVASLRNVLADNGLEFHVMSTHLVSQAVCDAVDTRHQRLLSAQIWGDGDPEGVRQRAAERMKDTARAAAKLGVQTVVGFTGSSIFHLFNGWPPASADEIDAGYEDFARRWNPIMDVFDEYGVRYALEVMPGEIGYDIPTTRRTLEAIDSDNFGINFDPSHLHWQFIDEVEFLHAFPGKIFNVHMKDARRTLNGRRSILGGHLPSGHVDRSWDFVSLGHGDVPLGSIVRALNGINYGGPLTVEWEDSVMSRDEGAAESVGVLRALNYDAPRAAWFSAFRTPE